MPAACPGHCGLLCSTLWARPERGEEVPGEQLLLHRKTLPSRTTGAVVVGFAPLSYYYSYCSFFNYSWPTIIKVLSALSIGEATCRRHVVVASPLRLIVTTLGSILGADPHYTNTSQSVHQKRAHRRDCRTVYTAAAMLMF